MDQTKDDPEVYTPVNIGLPKGQPPSHKQTKSRMEYIAKIKRNKILEKEARKGECKVFSVFL